MAMAPNRLTLELRGLTAPADEPVLIEPVPLLVGGHERAVRRQVGALTGRRPRAPLFLAQGLNGIRRSGAAGGQPGRDCGGDQEHGDGGCQCGRITRLNPIEPILEEAAGSPRDHSARDRTGSSGPQAASEHPCFETSPPGAECQSDPKLAPLRSDGIEERAVEPGSGEQ